MTETHKECLDCEFQGDEVVCARCRFLETLPEDWAIEVIQDKFHHDG